MNSRLKRIDPVKAGLLAARLGWEPARSQSACRIRLPDYSVFSLTRKQFAVSAGAGFTAVFAAVYLFYLSVPAAAACSIAGLLVPRKYRDYLRRRRQAKLRLQFKEMLFSLSSSLAAGRSVENAFFASLDDLRLMYPESRSDLMLELEAIRHRCGNGDPLEAGLADFASRSGVEEIRQFADVFITCKRTGGNLIEIIRRTSQTIGEKIEINQEIDVMISRKRFEARIMTGVPFAFMAFLHGSAPDYMAPLYAAPEGYIVITAALLMLAACGWLMMRIMAIRL
ncbi:type II secretion system F family protein [Paenibacillus humicus]|uniref:type II secretion system F family protein n=1 Tax=Paenibacillus humicus TaxID=412861 RepID=UPI001FEA407B|nr:type II secretion system F family protein [Paenibacillus humicus]